MSNAADFCCGRPLTTDCRYQIMCGKAQETPQPLPASQSIRLGRNPFGTKLVSRNTLRPDENCWMYSIERICYILIWISAKFVPEYAIIRFGNGLTPNRRQVIPWINHNKVSCCNIIIWRYWDTMSFKSVKFWVILIKYNCVSIVYQCPILR